MSRCEKLFEAGVQFGHRTQCWNPKMAPFIWGKKEGIHLINVALTDIQLTKAEKLLQNIASKGLPILWVGTKKIARSIVSKYAQECESPYFANRWVGGTLTNYQEVKKAVKKMLYNEEIYQKSEYQDIYTKKELALLQKKVERSKRVISGIEKLSYPVGALIVTDVQKDKVAVKEAIRIGIPVIGFVDTNANPEGISIVIPTNDDLEDALAIISSYLAVAIQKGKEVFAINNQVLIEQAKSEQSLEEKKYAKKNYSYGNDNKKQFKKSNDSFHKKAEMNKENVDSVFIKETPVGGSTTEQINVIEVKEKKEPKFAVKKNEVHMDGASIKKEVSEKKFARKVKK